MFGKTLILRVRCAQSSSHVQVQAPGREEDRFHDVRGADGLSDLYTVNPDGTGLYKVTHAGLGADLTKWGTHPLTR